MLTTLLLSIVGQAVEPIDRWVFATDVPDGLAIIGRPEHVGEGPARALILDGQGDYLLAPAAARPAAQLTASAWVAVNATTRWGGIVGTIQDNGDAETGWLLGYDDDTFTFALSSTGADDGDGRLTYLDGTTPIVKGRWHHVAGTYDGATMRLYVDGRLDAESAAQSGPILYPEEAPYSVGAYVDANELYPMHGRLLDVAVFDAALDDATVRGLFERRRTLTTLPPVYDTRLRMTVAPYLQRVDTSGITVMWETSRPTRGVVRYGKVVPLDMTEEAAESTIHEVRLDGLDAAQQYFYQVACRDDLDQTLESPIRTFQTAVEPGTPYAFAVIGDTQASPEVVRAIAEHAWSMRPSFAVHAGDLVSTGSSKTDWTRHYFPNMSPLISRVPIFPVLGNHEGDADWYYRYTSAPDPEHRYTFTYGNARFFMVDSNRPTEAGTEQHAWLEAQLAAATEPWKIVVHHHPVYTSDSDDYGDTYRGASNQGDPRVRPLVPLYERHGVDLVFNGHVHFYERTWPIRAGRVVEAGGVIYVTAAGGGGSLEQFAPTRTWFSNTIMRGHHYCLVAVNGGTLQFKAYDLEGRLFDTMTLRKQIEGRAGAMTPEQVVARFDALRREGRLDEALALVILDGLPPRARDELREKLGRLPAGWSISPRESRILGDLAAVVVEERKPPRGGRPAGVDLDPAYLILKDGRWGLTVMITSFDHMPLTPEQQERSATLEAWYEERKPIHRQRLRESRPR